MAKVALTAEQKIKVKLERLTKETKHSLNDADISYTELAEKIGLSPQAVSQQFKKGRHMTLEVWLAAQMMLKGEL